MQGVWKELSQIKRALYCDAALRLITRGMTWRLANFKKNTFALVSTFPKFPKITQRAAHEARVM